ncbi:unnamed protein product [Musa hybrid cultivar]
MSLMALREQLNMLVNSMYIEGLLDQQFQQLQMLQDASSPGFVAEVITLFCEDAERILTELTKLVDQAVVEFQKVDAYVHQLKGSSSSVGAQNVKLACIQFRQFCEENNKDGCLNALNVVKHHYYLLRNKFDTMLQVILNLFEKNQTAKLEEKEKKGLADYAEPSRLFHGQVIGSNRTESRSRPAVGKRTRSGRVGSTESNVMSGSAIRVDSNRMRVAPRRRSAPFSSSRLLLRRGRRSHRPLPGRHYASGGGGDIDTRRCASYTTPFHCCRPFTFKLKRNFSLADVNTCLLPSLNGLETVHCKDKDVEMDICLLERVESYGSDLFLDTLDQSLVQKKMPKIKTSRVKYPEGWELIEPTLRELEAKMREAENDPHDGKRKCEALWPIFRIAHQKSRYIYDLYHRRKEISKELYEFCLDQGYADRNLIAKWKKPGYERLCCLRCMQTRDHNFATTCVCRVPKHLREEKVIECVHCGCRGCASGD